MRAVSLGALALGAFTGCGFEPWGDPSPRLFLGSEQEWHFFTCPVLVTPEQFDAFGAAFRAGDPLPPGFEVTDRSWSRTDLDETDETVSWTGERIWSVTVKSDPADLARANVYVDGHLVRTASRSSGIVEECGVATATLRFPVPPKGHFFRLKVEWVGEDGDARFTDEPIPGLRRPWANLVGWLWR